MTALLFLIPLAVAMGATATAGFLWAVRNGQFDDLDDPPVRALQEPPGRRHP